MLELPYTTDAGIGTRANLGIVVLQADETVENEMKHFITADQVALYHSRIPSPEQVRRDTLSHMQYDIEHSVALLPTAVNFDVIAYACTSAAAIIGEAVVEKIIQRNRPTASVTNPITATCAALAALQAKKISFISPYIESVSVSLRQTLKTAGHEIVASGSFNESCDERVARISEQSILDAIIAVGQTTACDAVFVSCTNLRVRRVIVAAEAALGIPIISSNQALAWHMLQLADVQPVTTEAGLLFRQLAPKN